MADSKWLDFWDFVNWTDETKRPLLTILEDIRLACDERQSLHEFDHSTGFNASNTFPEFLSQILDYGAGSPKNAIKMFNAVWPVDVPETDDFQDSGTVTANSPANLYTLSEILTDEFSYASGTLKHITDSDSGTQNSLITMAIIKQWFQVLNYPVYYLRRLKNEVTGNQFYNTMELQDVSVTVHYRYTVSPFAVVNPPTAFVRIRTSGAVPVPVDVYVFNDLNETGAGVPSTPQEVRDYTITTLGNNDSTWWSSTGHDLGDKDNYVQIIERTTSSLLSSISIKEIDCELKLHRIRFKTNDDYRVTSPNRYDTPKYWNGYYTGSSKFTTQITGPPGTPPVIATYSDFGTGKVNNDVEFIEMVEDGNDYYNIEVANPDYDDEPVLAFPPVPPNNNNNWWNQVFMLQALQLEAGETLSAPFKQTDPSTGVNDVPSQINNSNTSIYVKANTEDGLNLEFYTPAP